LLYRNKVEEMTRTDADQFVEALAAAAFAHPGLTRSNLWR
jgi:hypothetical protein